MIAEFRAAKIPLKSISSLMHLVCEIHISKAGVNNILDYTSDVLQSESNLIIEQIINSPHVYIDETSYNSNGKIIPMWVIVHGNKTAIIMNKSRGAPVLDTYFDKFDGIAITYGYPVYKRFNPGGKH